MRAWWALYKDNSHLENVDDASNRELEHFMSNTDHRASLLRSAAIGCAMRVAEHYTNEIASLLHPVCIGNDPLCPCQDGDVCHYVATEDTPAWPLPGTQSS